MIATRSAQPPARSIGLGAKLAYGFGSIAYGIKDNGFSTFLLLFYNQVIGVSAEKVGFAIMVALILDAFVDPVIGTLSDNLKSRWGRRHPFMYAAAIPVALSYLLLWNPPIGRGEGMILLWLFGTAVLVRTAISCYEVPSAALAPELTPDYNERTSILGYRYLFGWIGGMGMLLLTYAVFLASTPEYPNGVLNPEGYRRYAVVAGSVMAAAILISALGTHALIKTLPPRIETHSATLGDIFRSMRQSLRNRAFLILMLWGVFTYANQGIHFTLSASYLNIFVWLFKPDWLFIFTFAVMVGVLIAFLIATPVSRKLGKLRACIWFGALFLIFNAAPYILRHFGLFFHPGDPRLLPALMVFEVIQDAFSVASMIIGASMMSDVVEDDEVRTGQRKEGLFFAGSFFMQKCATGVGTGLSGLILAAAHFPAHAQPGLVPAASVDSLAIIFVVASLLLGGAGLLVASRFPIGEKDHEERLAILAERASHIAPLPASEPEIPIIPNRT